MTQTRGKRSGMTLIELVVALSVAGLLCAVAVPGAASVRRTFQSADAAWRLALVLREAQARAAASGDPLRVVVESSGRYRVIRAAAPQVQVAGGELGAVVASNYPGGTVEFGASGLPTLAGGTSPRAGHFEVVDGPSGSTVVVQLGGCVRCA
jgi:prepilin-type N-terminal cleavage/methylation domain-containing protein